MTTREEFELFVGQVKALETINFHEAAELVGLNYYKQVMPEIEKAGWLYDALDEALQEIKQKLLGKLLLVAMKGKGANAPDPASIKLIVAMIDSKALLKGLNSSGDDDEGDIYAEMRKLGLSKPE